MKNVVFWYIKTQIVPHRKLYVSAKEPTRLMLCQTFGFHGGAYEECRFLGYKNPGRASQEAYYVFVKEPTRLMLCQI
jgi:hypothetical protein